MCRLIPLVCLGILLFPKAFARGVQDFELLLNSDPAAAYEAAQKELDAWQDKSPVMDKVRIIHHWLMAATRTRQHPDDPVLRNRLRGFYEKTAHTVPIEERLDFYELYSDYLMLNNSREEALEVAQRFRTEATQNDRPEAIAAALHRLLSLHIGNSAWMNERIRYGTELLEFLKKETRLGEEQRINLQLFLTTNNLYGQKSDQKRLFERSIELALEKGAFRTAAIRLADQALALMYQESQDTAQMAALLERALDTARMENGHLTESQILGYQAFFFNYDRKFLKALEAARLAIQYTPQSDLESLAELYREEIVALNGLGRFEEAITKVKEVRRILPESMNGLMVGIQLFESTAYEHRGDFKSALESYKNFHKIYADYRDKEADEHYAKASADIGLALESQKTLLLQKDNELQATRLQATHRLWIAAIILTVLLLLAAASLVFSLWQMRLLKLSRTKMKNILGLIEEGIVMIRADFRADGRASRFLQKLYPEWDPHSSKDALDQLFPPGLVGSEQNSIIRETVGSSRVDLQACKLEYSIVSPK